MRACLLLLVLTGCVGPLTPIAPDPRSAAVDPSKLRLRDIRGTDAPSPPVPAGPVAIVSFWSTWCKPCKKELPVLAELHKAFSSRGLVVIAVSLDDDSLAENARTFARKRRLPFLVTRERALVHHLNPGRRLPYTVLIVNGRIHAAYGAFGRAHYTSLATAVERLLGAREDAERSQREYE